MNPRTVLKRLLKYERAVSVVFAHNHPSGDPTPSLLDLQLTWRLIEAANAVDLTVRDHVVIADKGYRSIMTMTKPKASERPRYSRLMKAMMPVFRAKAAKT